MSFSPKGLFFLKGPRHNNDFIQSTSDKYENLDFDKLNKAKRNLPNLFQIPLKCINIYSKNKHSLRQTGPKLHLTDDNNTFGLCFPGNHVLGSHIVNKLQTFVGLFMTFVFQ